jgi:hypothetical protein
MTTHDALRARETATLATDHLAAVAALAVLAMCTTACAHEALGHGGACLLLGGRISLLNNAFFRCTAHSSFIDVAGPAGNLAAGLIAFAVQGLIPPWRPALRFYALCVMAFSLFWEAGYVIFAMLHDRGDYVLAWNGFVGPTTWTVRMVGSVVGVAAYFLFSRMLALRARAFVDPATRIPRLLRTAWVAGVMVQVLAASLFAPDRFGAMHDAGLAAAAAFPLLFVGTRLAPVSPPAGRIPCDARIIAAGCLVFGLFALTMGRGIY